MGSMTGRRFGYCSGYESPGFTRGRAAGRYGRRFTDFPGNRGFAAPGMGRRGGYGYGANQAEPRVTAAQQANYLEAEIAALKEELNSMEARLSEMKQED
jgi:hypothetical protein